MEKQCVLIVDDNESTCALITALLRRDFHTETASDGAEAVGKLRSRRYACVLLDLLMPGTNGLSVLEFLAKERPDQLGSVIVVTAALSAPQMALLDPFTIFSVVSKPFEIDSLQSLVRRCAGGEEPPRLRGPFLSGSMLLLFAELMRRVP